MSVGLPHGSHPRRFCKIPASSATRAAVSLKCQRAKKYIPAGMAREIVQNTSLTPPVYQWSQILSIAG